MSALTLHIRPHSRRSGYEATWWSGKRPVGTVPFVERTDVTELRRRFLGLFQGTARPLVDREVLRSFGRKLFELWFGPVWDAIRKHLDAGPHDLLVRSEDDLVLDLPWELVELHGDLPLGCDRAWSLRRTPLPELAPEPKRLEPHPLRILFLAAAPTGCTGLDFDREEDALLEATAGLPHVVVHVAETGTLDELADLVAECRPHLVHLSGHGDVVGKGVGRFTFEDSQGKPDPKNASQISAKAFRGRGVRGLILNGCQTAQAVAGLCKAFVKAGIPLALGWSANVADDRAAGFTAKFYRLLARRDTLPQAAALARLALRDQGTLLGSNVKLLDPSFALPQLYCSVQGVALFEPATKPTPYQGPRTEYHLLGDGIEGLTRGYVGHRRERQELVHALRHESKTFAVITGLQGAGKSTFATRIANRLEGAGFTVRPLRATKGLTTRAEAARDLLGRLRAVLDEEVPTRAVQRPSAPPASEGSPELRLQRAIDRLKGLNLVLVLDNFEEVLEPETHRIADPELSRCYKHLAANLVGGSRVLVTSRYPPADTPEELGNVVSRQLPELDREDFLRFLHRDPVVDERIRNERIRRAFLEELYESLGGTPGYLVTIRELLRVTEPTKLEGREGVLKGPGEGDRICERLYDYLKPEAQALASRLAVSDLPVPLKALALITKNSDDDRLDEGRAEQAVKACLAYGLVQEFREEGRPTLYRSPRLLRLWLSAPLRLPAHLLRAVHSRLAAFWRDAYDDGQGERLRVGPDTLLATCRKHAQAAEERPTARWATLELARTYRRRGAWPGAWRELDSLPEEERDAEYYLERGILGDLSSKWGDARSCLRRAQKLSGKQPVRRAAELEALARHQLASVDTHQGRLKDARKNHCRALRIWRKLGDRAGEATTLNDLASLDLREGHLGRARRKFLRALARRPPEDRAGLATTLHQFASTFLHDRHYEDARREFHKALKIRQEIGDRAGEAATLHQLASIEFHLGNLEEASQGFRQALQIRTAILDLAGEAATLHELASISLSTEQHEDARENFHKALEIRQGIGDLAGEAATLHQLGSIDRRLQAFSEAREKLNRALGIRHTTKDPPGKAATLHELALLDRDQMNIKAARLGFEKARKIRQTADKPGEAASLNELGAIDNSKRHHAPAWQKIKKALRLFRKYGDREGERTAFFYLAHAANGLNLSRLTVLLRVISLRMAEQLGRKDSLEQVRDDLAFVFRVTPDLPEEYLAEADKAFKKDRGWHLVKSVDVHTTPGGKG